MVKEILYRPHIGGDCVLGEITLCQLIFEFCYHTTLIYNEYSNNIAERIGHYTQLPDSWCFCSLESLCSFISRGKSPKYSDRDRTYPVFAQKCNLKDGEISLEQAKFLDPSTINKWPQKYRLKTGDVLINSTGTGTVGRTRLFNQKYLAGYPFVVPDSHVSVIRTYDKICSEYVYTFMSSSSSQQFLEENLAGSTNQKELYIDVLKNMVISLPPYQEQLRIVSAIQKTFAKLDMIKESL